VKPLCKHAGQSNTRIDKAKGAVRACAKGVCGGFVARSVDCETCPLHESATTAPKAGQSQKSESRTPLPVVECQWKGEPAGPKGWHICENEDEPLGMVVCACKGCGPKCPGYAVTESKGA
jgi:hypothetical protein